MFYGWQHFEHMRRGGQALNPEGQSEAQLGQIVLICLAFMANIGWHHCLNDVGNCNFFVV